MNNSKYKENFHMPSEVACSCFIKLHRYLSYKQDWRKCKVRNDIYMEMRGYLVIWINNILKKWGRWENGSEITSLSWDAFMFCLGSYKESFDNIPDYFYQYTRYFLFNHYAKKDSVKIPFDELKMIIHQFPTPENQSFEKLLTLYQFREVVPEKYRSIWDDAAMSLGPVKQHVVRYDECGLRKSSYCHIKNIMMPIIKLILGIKE